MNDQEQRQILEAAHTTVARFLNVLGRGNSKLRTQMEKTRDGLDSVICEMRTAPPERAHWLRFMSCVLSIRIRNTPEWMEYIAEEVNRLAEAIGDEDRFRFDGDGLRKIRTTTEKEA